MYQMLATGPFALVGWLTVLFVDIQLVSLQGVLPVLAHLLLPVLLFVMLFRFFFRRFHTVDVFEVTIATTMWLFLFEGLFYFLVGPSLPVAQYTYVGWILPLFVVATTVYWVGTINQVG